LNDTKITVRCRIKVWSLLVLNLWPCSWLPVQILN